MAGLWPGWAELRPPGRHLAPGCDAHARGDEIAQDAAEAYRIFDGLLPWVQNMESGSYNQKAKLGLAHLGIPCGDVRGPLLPLDAGAAAELVGELDAARG